MLLNEVLVISIYRGNCDKTNLLVIAHDLLVDIERRHIILLECTFANESIQIFAAFGIDTRIVNINLYRHVDFGFVDVQKTIGVVLSKLISLFSI